MMVDAIARPSNAAAFVAERDIGLPDDPPVWNRQSFPLESVMSTQELDRRPRRVADHAAENRALVALAQHMGESPRSVLWRLAETTLELCSAGSAGVSILEPDGEGEVFRWHALAGALSGQVGRAMPRDFSPCGTVVDRNEVALMSLPERHFTYFAAVKPTIFEALLVPFVSDGQTAGAIWVVMHDKARHFDAEDARLVGNLASFASAAYQMTLSLQRVKDQERRKDEFLAVLAHELRSPLGALNSATQFLHLRLQGLPDRGLDEINDRNRRQIKAMTRMIDDLLDVSGFAQGKIALHCERVELSTVVQQAIETSRPQIDAAHHTLIVELPGETVWLDCDPIRLAQAITNLLNNAAKYMPEGGRIQIRAQQTRSEVEVRVLDHGIGIAPGMLARIFELFTQVDGARARYRGGLGVGLNLVKRLTELHGGTVTAHSKGLGCGSEFVIHLPRAGSAS